MSPKVTAKEHYAGRDGEHEFELEPGESREVSKAKAEQLKRDFPERFDFGEGKRSAKEESGKRRTTSRGRKTTER